MKRNRDTEVDKPRHGRLQQWKRRARLNLIAKKVKGDRLQKT